MKLDLTTDNGGILGDFDVPEGKSDLSQEYEELARLLREDRQNDSCVASIHLDGTGVATLVVHGYHWVVMGYVHPGYGRGEDPRFAPWQILAQGILK